VVAAVSQAYEGALVNAVWPGASYEGLYYSLDGGATWSLATITDGAGRTCRGRTPVLRCRTETRLPRWCGIRAETVYRGGALPRLLSVLGRHHLDAHERSGSAGAATSTGTSASLSSAWCPTSPGGTGLPTCPIFRGTLA